MKSIKRLSALALALLMVFTLSLTAFAEDGLVTYEGNGNFTFGPGSDMSDTTLFKDLEGAMPGDVLTQKITVTNNSDQSDYVNIYLRAEPHDEGSNPLETKVKDTETVATMTDFLQQLQMKVEQDGKVIFESSPDKPAQLTENVLLGKFHKGDCKELIVTLTVPITLGNEYANRRGEVDWVFTVEELNETASLKLDKEITSKPADEKAYFAGETIAYKITVTNDGNVSMKDVEVKDDLTGQTWTIEELKPGESKEFTTTYTVKAEDAKAGKVKNTATATGTPDSPDLEKIEKTAQAEAPTQSRTGHMKLDKVATNSPANGINYQLNETINYLITVTNDGEAPLVDLVVRDDLTGNVWTVDRLEPGEKQSFETSYKVTAAAVRKGHLKNTATAEGTNEEDGSELTAEASVTVPTANKGPKTGDENNILVWIALMAVAALAAVVVVLFFLRKKKDSDGN